MSTIVLDFSLRKKRITKPADKREQPIANPNKVARAPPKQSGTGAEAPLRFVAHGHRWIDPLGIDEYLQMDQELGNFGNLYS
jgi:hypothetical protein